MPLSNAMRSPGVTSFEYSVMRESRPFWVWNSRVPEESARYAVIVDLEPSGFSTAAGMLSRRCRNSDPVSSLRSPVDDLDSVSGGWYGNLRKCRMGCIPERRYSPIETRSGRRVSKRDHNADAISGQLQGILKGVGEGRTLSNGLMTS